MKVSYKESESPYSKNLRADMEATTHQKGGEAWNVTIGARPAGVIRRWVHWTAYPIEGEARVFKKSRAAALRYLHKMLGAP